jgi:hypothetical protein
MLIRSRNKQKHPHNPASHNLKFQNLKNIYNEVCCVGSPGLNGIVVKNLKKTD